MYVSVPERKHRSRKKKKAMLICIEALTLVKPGSPDVLQVKKLPKGT